MPQIELLLPKMGESITEATILKWLKKEGDTVEADEAVVEIATDKVDSEVPSSVAGTIDKILYDEGDVVQVGRPIVVINTGPSDAVKATPAAATEPAPSKTEPIKETVAAEVPNVSQPAPQAATASTSSEGRFYSPLVLNIARREGIGMAELETVAGTGKNNRVTKKDILSYLENKQAQPTQSAPVAEQEAESLVKETPAQKRHVETAQPEPSTIVSDGNTEIVEMDRMRRLIADHMVKSKQTSAHVTSFVEADVTNLVIWRNKVKAQFEKREGEKITFTPLFVEVIIKALKDFPQVNASVDGNNLIVKKNLNIGMATALPSGNLIVPVIKNADQYNLVGLTKQVNRLANSARNNKLTPTDIDGGTFTLSNVGTFGNLMGTPIINQPQLAIMATGAIKKKPVVIETPTGDAIAIRHMMFLSLSYDHRVIDGFMGGSFLRRVADYLEAFDINREI